MFLMCLKQGEKNISDVEKSLRFDLKPSRPVKEDVSLNKSIILAAAANGIFGTGHPPVFFCSFDNTVNSFFACECKFFHFSRILAAVRFATPTAFTASAIFNFLSFFFWFVTLFVSLLWMMERFSSTFSVKTAISDALKFCFQPLRETAGEAILAHAKLSPWSRHANVSNLGLAAFNPRLTNRCTNPLTNNAYLSPS